MSCRVVIYQNITGMAMSNPNTGNYLDAATTGQDSNLRGIHLTAIKSINLASDENVLIAYPKTVVSPTSIISVDAAGVELNTGGQIDIGAIGAINLVGSALTFNGVPITVP
jgi:hypothetical protein